MSVEGDNDSGTTRLPRAESVLAEDLTHEPGEYRAFGVAAESFERFLAMIEVRLRTGDRLLFAYHSLHRAEWNPSRGITLLFADVSLQLRGRNLGEFFSAIREQRAAWVCEADRSAVELASQSAVVIESIVTEEVRARQYGRP